MLNRQLKIAFAFSIIGAALVWLTFTGFEQNMHYYASIEELTKMDNTSQSHGLRVKGYMVPGSLIASTNSLEVSFVIEENGHELEVHYAKELPDTFTDGSEVLVEGKMTKEGYFDANMLMAKCPSKYESSDEYNTTTSPPHEVTDYSGTN